MKLRSYSVTVTGSFFLLLGCLSQSTDHRPVSKADAKGIESPEDRKEDRKADDKKAEDVKGEYGSATPPDVLWPAMGDDSGTVEPPDEITDGANDGCDEGEMVFEEVCTSKDRVGKVLKQRETEAVAKVKTAKRPKEQAEAAHDLMEQQMYQIDKHADDFDEIIEQLKQEKLVEGPQDNDEKP
jgi:hypothetical protein